MTWCASVSAAAFVFSQCEIDFSFVLTLFKLSKKILKKKKTTRKPKSTMGFLQAVSVCNINDYR